MENYKEGDRTAESIQAGESVVIKDPDNLEDLSIEDRVEQSHKEASGLEYNTQVEPEI